MPDHRPTPGRPASLLTLASLCWPGGPALPVLACAGSCPGCAAGELLTWMLRWLPAPLDRTGLVSPGKPGHNARVSPVEVRVLAHLASVVVVLPMLAVQHVVIKPGVQGDAYSAQEVIKLPVSHGDGAMHSIMCGDKEACVQELQDKEYYGDVHQAAAAANQLSCGF